MARRRRPQQPARRGATISREIAREICREIAREISREIAGVALASSLTSEG